ncbi:MAG: hypothetical protein U0165_17560 [Polyangiaceae bacterium]
MAQREKGLSLGADDAPSSQAAEYRDGPEVWVIRAGEEENEPAQIIFGSPWREALPRLFGASVAFAMGLMIWAHTAAYLMVRWLERGWPH